jgi:hypothetical protein
MEYEIPAQPSRINERSEWVAPIAASVCSTGLSFGPPQDLISRNSRDPLVARIAFANVQKGKKRKRQPHAQSWL